jgi:CubicO group peptidase (beta-lactamase class C family)
MPCPFRVNKIAVAHPTGPHRPASPACIVLFLVACALSPSDAWCAATPDERAARFDDMVSHYARCGYFRGTVLVAQHGQILYAKGFGDANQVTHTPNTTQTKFGIASITKQFTAALVLQQGAAGRLHLDGTVSDYLPWYRKDTGRRITVDQLLHHTSGLPPDYNAPEFSDSPQACRHYEPLEFAARFCQPDLMAEPGAKWAYSNCGYVLLGLILERMSGKPFDQLLSEQLLAPLGMEDTGMDRNDLAQMGGACGYTRHAGPRYTPGPNLDHAHIFSAGAMYSTAKDLLRWNEALSSTNFFPQEILTAMFTPGLAHWADGWFVSRIPQGQPGTGNLLAEMRGDTPGNFFTWVLRYPEQDAVVIVLRNGYGSTEHLEENLQAVLFGQAPHLPSRSPKDAIARAGQFIWAPIAVHPWLAALALLGLALPLWARRARGRARTSLMASELSLDAGGTTQE